MATMPTAARTAGTASRSTKPRTMEAASGNVSAHPRDALSGGSARYQGVSFGATGEVGVAVVLFVRERDVNGG
jgi:hypothetical protein